MQPAKQQKPFPHLQSLILILCIAFASACGGLAPVAATPTLGAAAATPLLAPPALATNTEAPIATSSPTRAAGAVAPLTATPTVCIDNMQVVLDLSLDARDAAAVAPVRSRVEKGWRVQNTGSCTWDTSYAVQFDRPNNPTWINLTPPVRLERTVRPGEMLDVWVTALAPVMPGAQQAGWKLVDGRGQSIGQPLVMEIETALLATGTAMPRAWFNAYPEAVEPGEQVALSWSVQDAKAVYLSTLRQNWQMHPVETTASRFVYPMHPTTYELHIVNGDGTVETLRVRVDIEAYDPPKITVFLVEPEVPLPGECLDITWETENRVHTVLIYRNDVLVYSGEDDDGKLFTCPPAGLGAVVYRIVVIGPGGEDADEQRIVIP